uniref:Dynein axonemal assembly factor 4 n=1 Tax=Anopheles atroparvus TaxID=41427 RepID=A0A182JL43_ANOAO
MPLLLKDYTWQRRIENGSVRIVVTVPFPGNKLQPGDIFTTEQFIKISRAPHYWELFLYRPIEPEASRCSILANEVVFELVPCDPTMEWDALEKDVPRDQKAALKEQYLERHRAQLEKQAKERALAKDRSKKDEIHRQIERERCDRSAIEGLLESAKERELKRMELAMVKEYRSPVTPTETPKCNPQPRSNTTAVTSALPATPPPVRRLRTLEVTFSRRTFVTPKRESTEVAEQEWTRKQAAARRATVGFADDDELRPEERNPEWLKQRGDTFFQQRNYLAAISAYSAGIRLTKGYYALFLNRSAAHLALENYQRCAEDCTSALELLEPPVEANRKARVACLARRGAALVKLGFLRQGYDEMMAASRLDPDEASLHEEVERLQRRLEQTTDSESD